MARLHVSLVAVVVALAVIQMTAAQSSSSEFSSDLIDEAGDARLFFNNQTSLTVSVSSLIYGLFSLLALAMLAALLAYYLFGEEGETGYSGYSGHASSGYASGRSAATASPYSHLFNSLSVLDWISLAEEVYRDFDSTNMDCQKRVICQLHQNENSWGSTARRMNNAFSYVQYLELLNLPEDVRVLLDQYVDAADTGRTSQTDCASVFPACKFNIVQLIAKYSSTSN